MFHHVPYTDDEASFHERRLTAARGHAVALSRMAVLAVVGGLLAASAVALISDSMLYGAGVMVVTILLDLARGHWSRELLAHIDAALWDLHALDAGAIAALTRQCGRHPHCGPVLERWTRQRHTLRERDARALTELMES